MFYLFLIFLLLLDDDYEFFMTLWLPRSLFSVVLVEIEIHNFVSYRWRKITESGPIYLFF